MRADTLRAVGDILLAEGLADLTFVRAAQQAGVSRTTLYKWWPSIGQLGHIRADVDPRTVVDQLWGPSTTTCSSPTSITEELADRLLANLFDGIATDG